MEHIAIISSSVRTGRRSHRVALYFKQFIESRQLATVEILDLMEYRFPLFDERLQYQPAPSEETKQFAGKVKDAGGVLIVTPEYNGGYPAALKNVIDLMTDSWKHKPVAISTVSEGPFGGMQVITSLQFSLWKIKALTAPALFPVPKVQDAFDESGKATDTEKTDKRATDFVNELLWCMKAAAHMKDSGPKEI